MARLSKEEKIRRLKEQIIMLENGKDPNDNTVFDNKYFYVRKKGQYYSEYIKTQACICKRLRRHAKQGYELYYEDIDEFEEAFKELLGYIRNYEL